MIDALFAIGRVQKILSALDWHQAQLLIKQTPLIGKQKDQLFFLLLVLAIQRHDGHVCLSLRTFDIKSAYLLPWIWDCWHALDKPAYSDWLALLNASTLLDTDRGTAPLVMWEERLYFQRLFADEDRIARYFRAAARQHLPLSPAVGPILNCLFSQHIYTLDWQKIAVVMSLSRRVTVISGGPGTGKTTTAAKIILAHALLASCMAKRLRILAAAPTGKAAARLTVSLKHALAAKEVSIDSQISLPQEAVTLHRLLGAGGQKRLFVYDQDHPLPVDILLVDEASMVDLAMMSAIIQALPKQAKLILLGDKEQLSSVEAGSILADLCQLFEGNYSSQRVKELLPVIQYPLPSTDSVSPIADTICFLQKSHRFAAHSGIGQLAGDIKEGIADRIIVGLDTNTYANVEFQSLAELDYDDFVAAIAAKYVYYLDVLKSSDNIERALLVWDRFRLLTATRHGKYGVAGLNEAIERVLCQQHRIQKSEESESYLGRPVMILKNDPKLKLWNGDIGITWCDLTDPNRQRVYFQSAEGQLRSFSPLLLPEHETAFVMTVHKAQGSEFTVVALVLPPHFNAILTRSLLYTAVTRAKQQLILYGQTDIIHRTIQTQNKRDSGLYARLKEP